MSFGPFASAESDDTGHGFCGAFSLVAVGAAAIVAAPALSGNRSFEIDPVNGSLLDTYGWKAHLDQPDFLTVMFLWHTPTTFYDAGLVIAELGNFGVGGAYARRLEMDINEAIHIVDKDGDSIGATGNNYVALDTDYYVLWYVDLRGPTRDILWFWKAAAWDKGVDVAAHGDGDPDEIEAIIFGTEAGKGLPTLGDPFYVDDMAVELNPHPGNALGSAEVMYKLPTVNGADGDFDGGVGQPNPDWRNVDEIPNDALATYDEGDVLNDQQSYEVANADGGDDVLAVRISGSVKRDAVGDAVDITAYLSPDAGVTRDYATEHAGIHNTAWRCPAPLDVWEQIDGDAISETLFNSLEVGIEITGITAPRTCQLSQIGLEYLIVGPRALPDDFPDDPVSSGVAMGSANQMGF